MTLLDKVTEILERVLPFIVALLILTVSFSLGEIKKIGGWEPVVIAILLSISITLFISVLMMYLGGKIEKRSRKFMENVESILMENRTHSKTSGVMSEFEVKKIESQAKEEVWVITPSFRLDFGILNECVIDNIKGNKKRKVKYKYLCPNTPAMKNTIVDLVKGWRKGGLDIDTIKSQVEIKFIDRCYVYGEIAIYDPHTIESLKVAMFLPHTSAFTDQRVLEKYSNGFYIDDFKPATYFRDAHQVIWDQAKEGVEWEKFIKERKLENNND